MQKKLIMEDTKSLNPHDEVPDKNTNKEGLEIKNSELESIRNTSQIFVETMQI